MLLSFVVLVSNEASDDMVRLIGADGGRTTATIGVGVDPEGIVLRGENVPNGCSG